MTENQPSTQQHNHSKSVPKKEIIINAEAVDTDTGKTISNSNLEDLKNQEKESEKKRKRFIATAKVVKWLLPIIIIILIIVAIVSFFFWIAAAVILGIAAFIIGIIVLIFKIIYRKVTSFGKK